MNEYETLYLLEPETGEERLKKLKEKIEKLVKKYKAEVILEKEFGKRKLAYLIKNHTYAIYFYLNYKGSGAFVADLERTLKLDEATLRFLTVRLADNEHLLKKKPYRKVTELMEVTLKVNDMHPFKEMNAGRSFKSRDSRPTRQAHN